MIINDALQFIEEEYGLEIREESLDLSNLEDTGEIGFLIESPQEDILSVASVEFPIINITGQNIKKK
jgi:hypothetical protein